MVDIVEIRNGEMVVVGKRKKVVASVPKFSENLDKRFSKLQGDGKEAGGGLVWRSEMAKVSPNSQTRHNDCRNFINAIDSGSIAMNC